MKKYLLRILLLVFILHSNQISAANICHRILRLIPAPQIPEKILWLDSETGGLDEHEQPMIEIGVKITGRDLIEVARFRRVLFVTPDQIQKFSPVALDMHQKSGLISELANGVSIDVAERELIEFIKTHYKPGEPIVPAGNSIHFDRRFMKRHMPTAEALLHYRNFDISSVKIAMQVAFGIEVEKQYAHFALDDIDLSIAELNSYLEFLRTK